jgi:hypothetical protein
MHENWLPKRWRLANKRFGIPKPQSLKRSPHARIGAIRPAGFASAPPFETVLMQASENSDRVHDVCRGAAKAPNRANPSKFRITPTGSCSPKHSGVGQEGNAGLRHLRPILLACPKIPALYCPKSPSPRAAVKESKNRTETAQWFFSIYASMVGPEGFEPPTKRL